MDGPPGMTGIPEMTRKAIRQAHADLGRAVERAENVTRPDGTDGHGHPGIAAANLEGYLGRFTVPLLNELERIEALWWSEHLARQEREGRADRLRLRVILFLVTLVVCALLPSPWGLLVGAVTYIVFVLPAIR